MIDSLSAGPEPVLTVEKLEELAHLKENGLRKGKVQIAHCMNESAARQ